MDSDPDLKQIVRRLDKVEAQIELIAKGLKIFRDIHSVIDTRFVKLEATLHTLKLRLFGAGN